MKVFDIQLSIVRGVTPNRWAISRFVMNSLLPQNSSFTILCGDTRHTTSVTIRKNGKGWLRYGLILTRSTTRFSNVKTPNLPVQIPCADCILVCGSGQGAGMMLAGRSGMIANHCFANDSGTIFR